jgi:hypothetical protein
MIVWQLDALIFDVVTAFLTGDLEEEIYMECPEGLEHEDDEILQLIKAVDWYKQVDSTTRNSRAF